MIENPTEFLPFLRRSVKVRGEVEEVSEVLEGTL